MVVLKKIRAATLVETLVASALIVMVFLIASLCFNNIFKGVAKANDQAFQDRVIELSYFAAHRKLVLPFYEETLQWEITIERRQNALWFDANYLANSKKDIEFQLASYEN